MFDLSKEKIEVKCNCGRLHKPTLQDVANGKTLRCSCGTNINLKDDRGSVKKGVADINKAFKDLENAFKKIGR